MSYDDPFQSSSNNNAADASNGFNAFEEDPAAEFLEREKRELGNIAGGDHDTYDQDDVFGSRGGISDGRNSLTSGGHANAGGFGHNSLLTNGSHSPLSDRSDTPSTTMMSHNVGGHQGGSNYSGLEEMNEPPTLKKWREEFQQRIVKKRFG